jgi:hypothetical protein
MNIGQFGGENGLYLPSEWLIKPFAQTGNGNYAKYEQTATKQGI